MDPWSNIRTDFSAHCVTLLVTANISLHPRYSPLSRYRISSRYERTPLSHLRDEMLTTTPWRTANCQYSSTSSEALGEQHEERVCVVFILLLPGSPLLWSPLHLISPVTSATYPSSPFSSSSVSSSLSCSESCTSGRASSSFFSSNQSLSVPTISPILLARRQSSASSYRH